MGSRILVIEDNAPNLELMIYLLNSFGHTTVAARNGEDGVHEALAHPPDLIVCDLALPRLDGFDVVRRLRVEPATKDVPIIAVTAFAMSGDRDKVLGSGFDGYITKPIAPETFVSEIERFLHPDPGHGHDSRR